MAGINLIIDQYTNKNTGYTISLTKSNANHIVEIPYRMDSYQPLISYLMPHVPSEWQQSIDAILQAERDLIKQRQALMQQYKDTLRDVLPSHITQFKQDHPEYFI